jgi:hypothetical protein
VADDVEPGAVTSLSYYLELANQLVQNSFAVPVGLIVEDFETGDFSALNWVHDGATHWSIVSDVVQSGQYAIRSGAITHYQVSILEVQFNMTTAGTIRFDVKTSTEPNNDRLRFYVNNNNINNWSGETNWTTVECNVPAGNNTLRWSYQKDASGTQGQDAVWIDNIIFPSGNNVLTPIAVVPTTEIDWGNVGDGDLPLTANFRVINLGNQNLTVSMEFPSYYSVTNLTTSILPAQSREYTLSFTGNVEGDYDDILTIQTNDLNNPVIEINIRFRLGNVADEDIITTPLITKLKGNYPNPFNPQTTISFTVGNAFMRSDGTDKSVPYNEWASVQIDIYNIKGQKVRSLVNGV